MMGGNSNDNTIFTLMRLLPNGEEYARQVPYIESMNGEHSTRQAIRLKQLFYDFEADYIIMDTAGNGISLYDDCAKVLYDSDRDIEYPAFCAMNNEEMANRALDKNALPLIFSMKSTSAQLNHEIAVSLRSVFQKKKIKLLINEIEGKEFLQDKLGLSNKSIEEQSKFLKPYIQTTAMINEIVNLEYQMVNGLVKIKEVGKNRKDRFSSISFANYYADILEKELKSEDDDPDDPLVFY
jgi:hypothetical protein